MGGGRRPRLVSAATGTSSVFHKTNTVRAKLRTVGLSMMRGHALPKTTTVSRPIEGGAKSFPGERGQ